MLLEFLVSYIDPDDILLTNEFLLLLWHSFRTEFFELNKIRVFLNPFTSYLFDFYVIPAVTKADIDERYLVFPAMPVIFPTILTDFIHFLFLKEYLIKILYPLFKFDEKILFFPLSIFKVCYYVINLFLLTFFQTYINFLIIFIFFCKKILNFLFMWHYYFAFWLFLFYMIIGPFFFFATFSRFNIISQLFIFFENCLHMCYFCFFVFIDTCFFIMCNEEQRLAIFNIILNQTFPIFGGSKLTEFFFFFFILISPFFFLFRFYSRNKQLKIFYSETFLNMENSLNQNNFNNNNDFKKTFNHFYSNKYFVIDDLGLSFKCFLHLRLNLFEPKIFTYSYQKSHHFEFVLPDFISFERFYIIKIPYWNIWLKQLQLIPFVIEIPLFLKMKKRFSLLDIPPIENKLIIFRIPAEWRWKFYFEYETKPFTFQFTIKPFEFEKNIKFFLNFVNLQGYSLFAFITWLQYKYNLLKFFFFFYLQDIEYQFFRLAGVKKNIGTFDTCVFHPLDQRQLEWDYSFYKIGFSNTKGLNFWEYLEGVLDDAYSFDLDEEITGPLNPDGDCYDEEHSPLEDGAVVDEETFDEAAVIITEIFDDAVEFLFQLYTLSFKYSNEVLNQLIYSIIKTFSIGFIEIDLYLTGFKDNISTIYDFIFFKSFYVYEQSYFAFFCLLASPLKLLFLFFFYYFMFLNNYKFFFFFKIIKKFAFSGIIKQIEMKIFRFKIQDAVDIMKLDYNRLKKKPKFEKITDIVDIGLIAILFNYKYDYLIFRYFFLYEYLLVRKLENKEEILIMKEEKEFDIDVELKEEEEAKQYDYEPQIQLADQLGLQTVLELQMNSSNKKIQDLEQLTGSEEQLNQIKKEESN
jgi:hypothetical protein